MTIFSHRVYNSLSTIGQKCDTLLFVPKEWNETFAADLRSENISGKEREENEHEEVQLHKRRSPLPYPEYGFA